MSVTDDIVEIQQLVHRYCDAVVQRDEEQWGSTWAVDAVWNLGQGRRVEGRDAIVDLWRTAMQRFPTVFQVAHNNGIHVDGDSATGRFYITESMQLADGGTAALLAYYDDTYTRTPDGWRFASRELTPVYQGPPDLTGTWPS